MQHRVLFIGDFEDVAYVQLYPFAAPDVYSLPRKSSNQTRIDLRLDGKPCTSESKDAFLDALGAWLQQRYYSGDLTYAGLSAFVEQSRVEHLQPMEGT